MSATDPLAKCGYIYRPKGQAGEYAEWACNPYRGCPHACAYCYVPQVLKMPRPEFNAGGKERPGFLKHLEADAKRHRAVGSQPQVMLSFTTDPYHQGDTSLTRQTLEVLRRHGLGFCTLTKGGTRALRDLDLFRPDRDAFACTLTSPDGLFARKWEPGAASPTDRLAALRCFHEFGIFTWVSLEPVLDVDASLDVVRATAGYVDLYKVGRANYLPQTKAIDWREYTARMVDLLHGLGKPHYIKADLQPFLPPGYVNPVRVQQHHG